MPLLRWMPAALCVTCLLAPPATLAADPQPAAGPDWRASPAYKNGVLDDVAFRAIQEHYPDEYARIDAALDKLLRRGASADEVLTRLRMKVQDLAARKAATASDEAVVRWMRSTMDILESINSMDANGCHGMLSGDRKLALDFMARLPPEVMREMLESAAAAIASSRLAPRPAPPQDAIEADLTEALTPLYEKYGDRVRRLDAPDLTPEERAVTCRLASDSFRAMLTLPQERAGPLLRWMLSQEEVQAEN